MATAIHGLVRGFTRTWDSAVAQQTTARWRASLMATRPLSSLRLTAVTKPTRWSKRNPHKLHLTKAHCSLSAIFKAHAPMMGHYDMDSLIHNGVLHLHV